MTLDEIIKTKLLPKEKPFIIEDNIEESLDRTISFSGAKGFNLAIKFVIQNTPNFKKFLLEELKQLEINTDIGVGIETNGDMPDPDILMEMNRDMKHFSEGYMKALQEVYNFINQ